MIRKKNKINDVLPLLLNILIIMMILMSCDSGKTDKATAILITGINEKITSTSGNISFSRYNYQQGSAPGEVWIIRISYPAARLRVVTPGPDPNTPLPLSKLLNGIGSFEFAGINGAFFYSGKKGPMGLVVSDGELIHKVTRDGGSGIFLVRREHAAIIHHSKFQFTPDIIQGLQSIDRLVSNGKSLVQFRRQMPCDARSAVGIDIQGVVYLISLFK